MDIIGLVVESQRWCAARAETQLGFYDLDRQVESVVVPGGVGYGGEVVGARVRLFAATILILEREAERLARVETVERSVERRRDGHPERGSHGGRRLVELEQRLERRLWLARAGEPSAPHARRDLPAEGRGGVTVETLPRRVDLDHAPLHAHAPDRRRGADGLQDRHEAGAPARGAHDVEGFPLPLSRLAGALRPHQLALEREERPECASAGGQLERDRRCTVGNELLYAGDEVVRELPRIPRPPPHVPRPAEVPWQLEHVLGATRQVHDIEQVPRPGNDRARDLLVAAANPGPLARRAECPAHRAARSLGRAV